MKGKFPFGLRNFLHVLREPFAGQSMVHKEQTNNTKGHEENAHKEHKD